MKITMSTSLLADVQETHNALTTSFDQPHINYAEQLLSLNNLKHYSITSSADEMTLEVSDEVIRAYFKLYRRVASFITPLRALFKLIVDSVRDDVAEIESLIQEERLS